MARVVLRALHEAPAIPSTLGLELTFRGVEFRFRVYGLGLKVPGLGCRATFATCRGSLKPNVKANGFPWKSPEMPDTHGIGMGE